MLQGRPHEDRWGPRRARIIAGVLALLFVVVVGRSGYVALNHPAEAAERSAVQQVRRADIVDRRRDLLATSLSAWSLAADPRAIWDAREVANAVAFLASEGASYITGETLHVNGGMFMP